MSHAYQTSHNSTFWYYITLNYTQMAGYSMFINK